MGCNERKNGVMEVGPSLFDEMFGVPFWFGAPAQKQRPILFKTDIKKVGDEVAIEMELPGFEKKDVDITVDGNLLTISAKRVKEVKEEDKETKYIRRERYVGNCVRTFELSEESDPSTIKAKLENGLLVVTFKEPKGQEKPKLRKIEL